MRWERLFADLEAQLETAEREEFDAEVADRTRREVALVGLSDRLREAVNCPVRLTVAGAGTMSGVIRRVGSGWLLLDEAAGREVVVATAALLSVAGLPAAASAAASVGAVASRLRLGHVLRGIARDRAAVTIVLSDGSRLEGTVDRVGADWVDLADHPAGEPRRSGQVRRTVTISIAGLAVVRAG